MFMLGLAVAGLTMNVLSGASQAKSQAMASKYQNMMAANQARHEAKIAEINAGKQAMDTVSNQLALEQQTMQQALQDAAIMAQTKISHAGSGVAMDSASKYEVRANQKMMHIASMANAEANRVQALENDRAKMMQYRTNAMMSRAGAEASSIVANSIHPNRIFAQQLLTGGLAGATQFGVMTGAFKDLNAASVGGSGSANLMDVGDRTMLDYAMG